MKNEKYQSLKTLAVLVLAALIFGEIFKDKGNTRLILTYVAMGFSFIMAFWPWATLWVHRAWMKFGELLGTVMSTVILSLIFYLILTPLGWLSRIMSKNPKFVKGTNRTTYYNLREKLYRSKDIETTW